MRVAVLTPGYAPTVGGVETTATHLCEGLAARGVEVEVWTHRPEGPGADHERVNGVDIRRFAHNRSARFPVSPSLWAHARRARDEVDLVHAHSYHSSAAVGALFASGVPVVFTPHYHGGGHTAAARILHLPYRWVGRRLFARALAVVAVSEAERSLIVEDFAGAATRTEVIHNAVRLDSLHRAEPFDDVPPTLLVLGRLERYKRVDLVLQAFGQVSRPGRLVIVGDGPDRGRLQNLVERHPRRDDIRLPGRLDRADVDRWLRTARGVVNMSEHEAFGIVGLEGVAAGARAVLSDLPAHRELRELLPPGLVEITAGGPELAASLTGALTRALSEPNAGPRPVRDWTSVADEYLALYRRILASAA